MSIYFVDEVQITPIIRNATFRTETEGATTTVEAYVEDDDRITYGRDGTPIRPAKRVFLPFGISIAEGDMIRITKRFGTIVTETSKQVSGVSPVGAFEGSHIEVVVGGRRG